MCPTNIGVSATLLCLTLLTASAQQLSTGDQEFLHKAQKGGLQEVDMGKTGMERGSSSEVKSYSQTLVNDHKKANQELMALAKSKGVVLAHDLHEGGKKYGSQHDSTQSGSQPRTVTSDTTSTRTGTGSTSTRNESNSNAPATARSSDSRQGSNSLDGKTGSDFDKEFARLAVAHHQKDIATFEDAARSSSDPEIKAWANKTLPTLRSHLKAAQNLKQ